jgi:hypothetical protein
MFADLIGGEFWPCCHPAFVNGSAPTGDGGQPHAGMAHAGMVEGKALADGLIGDDGVG